MYGWFLASKSWEASTVRPIPRYSTAERAGNLDDADGQELPILDQLISAFEFSPTEANDIRTWAEDMAPAIAKGWLLVDGESSEAGR